MVGVHTHVVIFQIKGILAELDMFEFIFVEVRPTPQSSINHMRKTLPSRYLGREYNIMKTPLEPSVIFVILNIQH